MDYAAALAYLDEHANYEKTGPHRPRRRSTASSGSWTRWATRSGPYPVIHVTGTNGKGSTAQIDHPPADGPRPDRRHLHQPAPRAGQRADRPQRRADRRRRLRRADRRDRRPRGARRRAADYFEIVTAAAFRWFADVAVDVAVVEVGLLGRWDATNVVDAQVAVVTNVGIDHTEFAGPTLADIAREKAGIVKPGSTLVLGETDPELVADLPRRAGASVLRARRSTSTCVENQLALGGRLLDLRTPTHDLPRGLPAAARPPPGRQRRRRAHRGRGVLRRAARRRRRARRRSPTCAMPGRFEVLGHQPLVIVDGAHNPPGADTLRHGVLRRLRPGRPARSWSSASCAGRDPRRCSRRCGPTSSTS